MDQKFEDKFKKSWQEEAPQNPESRKCESWEKFCGTAFTERKRTFRKLWRYAAAILLLTGSATGMLLQQETDPVQENTKKLMVITNPGITSKSVVLSDSSRIILQPGSRIEFAENFRNNRNLQLYGEAYFEVAKDREHPFSVVCDETVTTVLGTAFNIRESTTGQVNIQLYEGSIRMKLRNEPKNWLLAPGEEIVYAGTGVSVQSFERYVDFDDQQLSSVFDHLLREYGFKVIISPEYLKKTVTLRIGRKEDPNTICKTLGALYNLDYSLDSTSGTIRFTSMHQTN
ncbi:FecR family protein [Robertkochia solimangrovi]|uniref:FecR family protein n=1 Tax=Robertkochia solimangrovi TaxID=2213046 RepID=UPI0013A52C30|nr:FecR domain-containing protein [Robertkochia solimangrovi]